MHWNPGDEVEVRFSNATFFNAVYVSDEMNGWHLVDLDDPLPTMQDCGLTHQHLDEATTTMPRRVKVQDAACVIERTDDHHIRDRTV